MSVIRGIETDRKKALTSSPRKYILFLFLGLIKFSVATTAEECWMYSGLSKPHGHDLLEEILIHTVPITAVRGMLEQYWISRVSGSYSWSRLSSIGQPIAQLS